MLCYVDAYLEPGERRQVHFRAVPCSLITVLHVISRPCKVDLLIATPTLSNGVFSAQIMMPQLTDGRRPFSSGNAPIRSLFLPMHLPSSAAIYAEYDCLAKIRRKWRAGGPTERPSESSSSRCARRGGFEKRRRKGFRFATIAERGQRQHATASARSSEIDKGQRRSAASHEALELQAQLHCRWHRQQQAVGRRAAGAQRSDGDGARRTGSGAAWSQRGALFQHRGRERWILRCRRHWRMPGRQASPRLERSWSGPSERVHASILPILMSVERPATASGAQCCGFWPCLLLLACGFRTGSAAVAIGRDRGHLRPDLWVVESRWLPGGWMRGGGGRGRGAQEGGGPAARRQAVWNDGPSVCDECCGVAPLAGRGWFQMGWHGTAWIGPAVPRERARVAVICNTAPNVYDTARTRQRPAAAASTSTSSLCGPLLPPSSSLHPT